MSGHSKWSTKSAKLKLIVLKKDLEETCFLAKLKNGNFLI